jgi:hypothetical protein
MLKANLPSLDNSIEISVCEDFCLICKYPMGFLPWLQHVGHMTSDIRAA